ncbi:hypothetical protein [Bacteroides finegoldii]|jgi:cation transport ATPase|uniref:hypothetical protein n=1 Tax=Bacteroides finegoldii TaxID=338188 RepID=UPI00189F9C85|nr:hypothetical protein [Bacteroides finegoldii]MDC7141207.1 hypothetical protein [Bacteroides finegoldii]DAO13786.1 MAG TPA: hypothetical protein [Caudoviricetes sp.]DAW70868.1 MAG TPA: hypothetical protein [Caudoviricetes sp.]
MDIYTSIRNLLASVFSVMFAYFAPIQNMVFVIFFVFAINCMAGMIAGIVAKHERFNLKKFFHCMLETFVFYVIVLSVFTIGEKMRNLDGAIQCITGVVYAILYFYGVNTLRNLNILFPESKVIRFLFYVLSFEVVKKIPYMQQFINKEKEGGK